VKGVFKNLLLLPGLLEEPSKSIATMAYYSERLPLESAPLGLTEFS
jgi:hypothetical protein